MSGTVTATSLAERLRDATVAWLESLVDRHVRDFVLPRVYAGHPVGADVRADLAYTLTLLADAGVERVAGVDVDEALRRVLERVDGRATHTFFSSRVAETLLRHGRFGDNALVAALSPEARRQVALACDSSDWIPLLDGTLPANYAAVLARCERGRAALGLDVDPEVLDGLVDRTRTLLGRNGRGYLDDAEQEGGARYDIYTPDVYLFTEPLADRLGAVWDRGVRSALTLVESVAARTGAAVSWGRSSGALASCLTVELAALVLDRGLDQDPARWLDLGAAATDHLDGWFAADGVVTAHQHRSTYHYRGPERRLQMTLDCLGKLAWSAGVLGRAASRSGTTEVTTLAGQPFPDRDELIAFEDGRPVGVWSYRSRQTAFVLPLVGPTRSDYLPALRNPTLFEVPVDASLATGVPVAHAGGFAFAGGGIPTRVDKQPARLTVAYDGLAEVQTARSQGGVLGGRRTATIWVDGRTVHGDEDLRFDEAPDAVSFQVTEARHRPLRVQYTTSAPHRTDVIDTSGLKEQRSFWGELPTVHQLDVEPATEVRFRWSITPKLRIGTEQRDHHYHRSLYDPLAERVHERSMNRADVDDRGRAAARFPHLDVFHLHWPEWFVGVDVDAARRFVELLDRYEVRLVWTQHNRRPHLDLGDAEPVYRLFAARADAVIHHSAWGRDEMVRTYRYGDHTRHRVIPHGHWGNFTGPADPARRAAAEEALDLEPCRIRVGIIGAPRPAKHTQRFMEAFTRSRRDDLQLVVLSLDAGEEPPDDPRIRAWPYEFVPREVYDQRLAALDVIALPFDADGQMLTTGVVGDAVALGLPTLVSDWGYLTEVVGDAGIRYRTPEEDLVEVLDALDHDVLARSAAGMRGLQERYAWSTVAEQHWALLDEVGTAKL